MAVKLGKLDFEPVEDNLDLVSAKSRQAIEEKSLKDVLVTAIDDKLSDTAAFCQHYGVGLDVSANCVIVEAKRGDKVWYAACIVLATTRADINGVVRKHLDARKVSFAPMDKATASSGMEYGAITPIGLPPDWPVLVDAAVVKTPYVVIGSGHRGSKLLVPGALLADLPNSTVLDLAQMSPR